MSSALDGLAELTPSGSLEEPSVLLVPDTQNLGTGFLMSLSLGTELLDEDRSSGESWSRLISGIFRGLTKQFDKESRRMKDLMTDFSVRSRNTCRTMKWYIPPGGV